MAKPSWVTTNPLNHTSSGGNEETTVQTVISANGTQSNRSGTITVVGTVGSRTITRTISVSQQWAATLRLMWSSGQSGNAIQTTKGNVEDNTAIQADFTTAGTLRIGYPFLGGSNICNYTCTKSNGVFNFELNTVHIESEDDEGVSINADYWDLPSALFVPINGGATQGSLLYTPVIRFSYNPTTGIITIVDTLYSLGGVNYICECGGGYYADPICPDWNKMLRTGEVGNESNGYGAMLVHFLGDDQEGEQTNITWPMFRWYPRITKTVRGGISTINVMIVGQGTGATLSPDAYAPIANLTEYDWNQAIAQQYYIRLFIEYDAITVARQQMPNTANEFYRQDIYVEIYV